jgi:hypothetical protein
MTDQHTDPSSMRAHALALHADIRAQVERVLKLSGEVRNAEATVALELAKAMQELAYTVRRHVVAEEREAAEVEKKLNHWGAARLALLNKDHERELSAVFNVEYYGSHLAMAEDAAAIASEILSALQHEERVLSAEFAGKPRS